jgi:hypothetical protein
MASDENCTRWILESPSGHRLTRGLQESNLRPRS